MFPKRFLPLAALAGLGFGLAGPSAPPASASSTTCWTVINDQTVYAQAFGPRPAGFAFAGDTFENINGIASGLRRYGLEEQTGADGWMNDSDLTNGHPCG